MSVPKPGTPEILISRSCKGCASPIPEGRASNARYCSGACRDRSGMRRRYHESEKQRNRVKAYARKWSAENRERRRDIARRSAQKRRADPEVRARDSASSLRSRHLKIYGAVLDTLEDKLRFSRDRFAKARALGFRSGLEVSIAKDLKERGVEYEYESQKFPYTFEGQYVVDFRLPNGIFVEVKGEFPSEDRRKMRMVKKANPDADIRIVFSRPNSPISKRSPTSYAAWCERNGFKWAAKVVPQSWIDEEPKRE